MRFFSVTCAAALVAISAARAADLSGKELTDARKLYNAKCAKCHKFYDPANYSDAAWHKWMTKMSRKSKLQPEQEELLSRFLDAFRTATNSESRPTAPRP